MSDEIFDRINEIRKECVEFISKCDITIDTLKEMWLTKNCPVKIGDRIASGDPNFYFLVTKIYCSFTNYGVKEQRILWTASGEVKNLEGVTTKFMGLATFSIGKLWFKDKGYHESNGD